MIALALAAALTASVPRAVAFEYEDCERLLAEQPADSEGFRCLFQVAVMGKRRDDARTRLEAVVKASPQLHWARLYLGRTMCEKREYAGLDLFREAIAGFERDRDGEAAAIGRIRLAYYLEKSGAMEAGVVELDAAERWAAAAGRDDVLAEALAQRGLIVHRLGRLSEADLALRRAEALVRENDPLATRMRVLDGLAILSRRRGRYAEALAHAEALRAEALRLGYRVNLGNADQGILNALAMLEAWGVVTSDELRRVALRTLEENPGRSHAAATALAILGDLSERAEAERRYDAAIAIYDGSGRRPLASVLTTVGLGLIRVAPGRSAEAWTLLEEAHRTVRETTDKHAWGYTEGALAAALWLEGRREEAIRASLETLDAVERLRDEEPDPGSRAGTLAFESVHYRRLAGNLLAIPAPPEDLALAFAVLERMRARALLEHLDAAGMNDAPPEIVGAIAAAQRRLADPDLSEGDREAAKRRLADLELREDEARRARVRSAVPPVFATLEDVRTALEPDEAMLVYSVSRDGDGGSVVLRVTREDVRVARLPDARAIRPRVDGFAALLERRDGSEVAAARSLGRMLLEPESGFLPPSVRRLVVLPDAVLWSVPFDALRTGAAGAPASERFEISVVPSATLWHRWRTTSARPADIPALIVADPATAFDGEEVVDDRSWALAEGLRAGRLPRTASEGKALAGLLGAPLLAGSRASERRLKTSALSRYGVIHFATHAFVDDVEPRRSAVLLAPGDSREDGLLQPREIAALDLADRVVVLSACRGADGVVLDGEGPLSLARAFFEAGARTVVAGLRPLRDEEAEALAVAVGRRLALGEPVGTAVAAAKREARSLGMPAVAWSTLVVLGDAAHRPVDPRALERAERDRPWPAIATLGTLAALAAWIVRFRFRV